MALRRNRQTVDIWPGFVDALGNLIIILMFVLLVFVMAQFFMGRALSGQEAELGRLTAQMSEMANLLKMERQSNAGLTAETERLSGELTVLTSKAKALEDLSAQKTAEAAKLAADIEALQALKATLEKTISDKDRSLDDGKGKLQEQERISDQARAQAAMLRQQLDALQQEMARLADSLDAAERANKTQEVQISDLGKQLNRALATKVQELQKYRSEFFGRLRSVLGDRKDVRIEGDRFVFQSEVLFPSGSADLQPAGQQQLGRLARTLLDIAKTIPADVNWILRVDGHTDSRPIATPQFRSNWDLSSARAISVVNYLISQGIDPSRLAAAGFGEFQPLEMGSSPDVLARNRRIELKLDQR
ncbi:peptidoglycan -binding protein [Novispirillum itersonii]|uniref:Chemotaxis protein MotB n=1 Tax=Novispirillum itersonii TaxID=189 RepID=A0A7W9ZDF1_NOVIT|nr:peptidoglycan -binding protein [Novispirillum itersonii]MBB6209452.1 chemotaxis protein MotB [Novispirillum itersonii]